MKLYKKIFSKTLILFEIMSVIRLTNHPVYIIIHYPPKPYSCNGDWSNSRCSAVHRVSHLSLRSLRAVCLGCLCLMPNGTNKSMS